MNEIVESDFYDRNLNILKLSQEPVQNLEAIYEFHPT